MNNMIFAFTIILGFSLDDYGSGGIVFTLAITNRYLVDIHNAIKGEE